MTDSDRFTDDPKFADAFTSAYTGRHHPADALWWMSHPDSTSQRGILSPAADHARLKAQAYSRSGGVEARQALARFEAGLEADRETTLDALRAARAVSFGATDAEVHAASAIAGTVAAMPESAHFGFPATDASPRVHARRGGWFRWAAITVIFALGVGIGVGLILSQAVSRNTATPLATGGTSSTACDTCESTSALAGQSIARWVDGTPKMLDIFDEQQSDGDIPSTIPSGIAFLSDKFHLVGTSGDAAVGDSSKVYVAQNTAGTPCLILIAVASATATMNCVPVSEIPEGGISVYLQTAAGGWSWTWSTDGSSAGSYIQTTASEVD